MSFASPIIGAVQHECRCGSGLEDREWLMQLSLCSCGGTAGLAAGTGWGSGAGEYSRSGLESQRQLKQRAKQMPVCEGEGIRSSP